MRKILDWEWEDMSFNFSFVFNFIILIKLRNFIDLFKFVKLGGWVI